MMLHRNKHRLQHWRPCMLSTAVYLIILLLSASMSSQAAAQVANDGQSRMQTQLRGELRKVVASEIEFLSRACELRPEQREQIKSHDAEPAIEAALAIERLKQPRPAVAIGQLQRQLGRPEIAVGSQLTSDAVQRFGTSLREEFKRFLSEDQRAIYDAELSARQEFAQRAAGECLVSVLDETLELETLQRERLVAALGDWATKNRLDIHFYFRSRGYLPMVPEQLISGILTPTQLKAYRNTKKATATTRRDALGALAFPFEVAR
jgi:hypothetical protein